MNKVLFTLMGLAGMAFSNPGHALVVSDPGAYTRMAQQIQQMQDQVKQLTSVVNEAKKINESITGNLQRGLGTDEDIRRLKTAVEKMLPTFSRQGAITPGTNDMERISNELDKIFISTERQPLEAELTKEQRDTYRKKAVNNAVKYSEYIITDTEKSLNKLEDLSKEINKTETMKDAQDLTNRYMQEMLANQTKLVLLLAQLVRAEGALKMQGVTASEGAQAKPYTTREYNDMVSRYGSKYFKADPKADTFFKELTK